jgi:hypothetical protein
LLAPRKENTNVKRSKPKAPAAAPTPAPPPAVADLIDVETAAAWLGLSCDCVRGWILRGVIAPVYNIGSMKAPRYRIPRETVMRKFELVEPLHLE